MRCTIKVHALLGRLLHGAVVSLAVAAPAFAAPITGQTGPGGVGQLGTGSGPLLWLKADAYNGQNGIGVPNALPANNTAGTWIDSSFFGRNAASNNPATVFQTGVVNGLPAARLPGGVNLREYTVGALPGANTFIGVVRSDGNFNCCDGLFGEVGSDSGFRQSNNTTWQATGFIGNAGVSVNGTGLNTFTGGTNVPGSGTWQTVTALSSSSPSHFNFGVGQYFSSGDREFNGAIGEVAVYTQALNTAQQQILNSHMGAKYGFAVTNDRYTGDTLSGHSRDVFGVGRLSAASQQANSGAAGLGIEATSGLGDGDFILAGHNRPTNSMLLDGKYLRTDRNWYVDKTDADNSTNTTVAFDFSDAGLAGQQQNLSLLYSATGAAGTFNALGISGNLSGDTLTFNLSGSQLINGYYAFGLEVLAPEPGSIALFGLAIAAAGVAYRRRCRKV